MDDLKKTLIAQMHQLDKRIDGMTERRVSAQSGVSTITVNAGNFGVWLCGTACCIMLAVSVVGGMWMSREFTRIDRELADRKDDAERARTYLSAIYAHAPQLKPKEEENAE